VTFSEIRRAFNRYEASIGCLVSRCLQRAVPLVDQNSLT
jgi:hypothetical protein